MEIEETNLKNIKDLLSFSSQFFLPTRKDGYFDVLKFCKKFAEKNTLKIFTTISDNQNIGYISIILDPENKNLDIGPMFVLFESSGKGYGKNQVEFILNFAKENNFKKIETRTWGKNFSSRKIFESLGFTKINEIENDRINGDSSVFYELVF